MYDLLKQSEDIFEANIASLGSSLLPCPPFWLGDTTANGSKVALHTALQLKQWWKARQNVLVNQNKKKLHFAFALPHITHP